MFGAVEYFANKKKNTTIKTQRIGYLKFTIEYNIAEYRIEKYLTVTRELIRYSSHANVIMF